MSEEQPPRPRAGIGEGLRAGIGILTAFKEAIEETIDEAAARNELRPERAREALTGALGRAQEALGDVRERLELVPRRDFDALAAEVAALRLRLDRLDGGAEPEPAPVPEGTPPVSGSAAL
jgi:polyhydroxyalkanoate synthesis regulator phasin